MNTEITKINDMSWLQGWVLYDHLCPHCCAWARRVEPILSRRGFDLAPLQSPWLSECLDCDLYNTPDEMKVLTRHGRLLGGADALLFLARKIWWAWPFWLFACLPGMRPALRWGYRRMAANRYCHGGSCSMDPHQHNRWLDWMPLLMLSALALALRTRVPGWVFMWLMSVALFAGMKWVSWNSCRRESGVSPGVAFLFGWPGMNPQPFLSRQPEAYVRRTSSVWRTVMVLMLGAFLLWIGPRLLPPGQALARGWSGMIGICLLLHFGLFELLAKFWRGRGVAVESIMHTPSRAKSLAEFWGGRWNRAFSDWAARHVSGPLTQVVGRRTALLAAFLISGAMHELVISLPAGAGYGGPTLYFMIQGLGLVLEQSGPGRRLGLGKSWLGRGYAWAFTVLPVPILFHPPFIQEIMLPMMAAWGAC